MNDTSADSIRDNIYVSNVNRNYMADDKTNKNSKQ